MMATKNRWRQYDEALFLRIHWEMLNGDDRIHGPVIVHTSTFLVFPQEIGFIPELVHVVMKWFQIFPLGHVKTTAHFAPRENQK